MKKKKTWQPETRIENMPTKEEVVNVKLEEPKVAFEGWWAMRSTKIPVQHYKEIVKADFVARGLGPKETVKTFDDALALYGVKL